MSSKKRVFSTNNTFNYNDLYKIKNGCEILKTIKSEDNNARLKQFKNYKQLQILNKAYFTFIDNNTIEVNRVRDLYSSNNSYSNNEDNNDCNNEHNNDCNNCSNDCKRFNKGCNNGCNNCSNNCNKECNNCNKECNNCNRDSKNECNNNQLYLKGKIITKKDIAQQFSSNIFLCNWCNNNNKLKTEDILHHSIKKNKIHQFCKCKCKCSKPNDNSIYNNCSLCKNAKQLFI